MKITTAHFGEIIVDEDKIIRIQGEILGFRHLSAFMLLISEQATPFRWLQSLDDPTVAFIVLNPLRVKHGYNPDFSAADLKGLCIEKAEDIALLAILTLRKQPFHATVNLKAPILINARKRVASQVVIDNPDYPIQYPVLENMVDFESLLVERQEERNLLNSLSSRTTTL